ncbi:MAG TPA: alpha-1,4-glucan--maltose-1-phosphate maltosyltransferase [Verrucomicrobiae bacterium]|nr:alpha-1,4-glucan--maltose-1-phosphate maltosyltransferase [Verrucomicrobiae bacterium]
MIENITPQIDGGRFAIKRTIGEKIIVEADIFADSHDALGAVLKFRHEKNSEWTETPMKFLTNDRRRGEFLVSELGNYFYTIEAWVDHFKSWQNDLRKKLEANQIVSVELQMGARLIETAAQRATAIDAENLLEWAKELAAGKNITGGSIEKRALDEDLTELTSRYPDRQNATIFERQLRVAVDRELARFGAWYELFPRSFAPEAGKHGTFKDCEAQLPRISKMGFDVLYLPPIHPIGKSFRKGKNNNPVCEPGEPGSPWAIGSSEGGHKAIHSELGTLEDFRRLVKKADEFKIEIALDIAFQCSPDHPYIREHPEWFRYRSDGSIQYAENPPKKYQDIVPFDFECDDWKNLWLELKSIFEFWIGQGVKIFRVDNPHTKTFGFWEWCLGELKAKNPEVIFLAEAFTRPKPMYRLAKLGFTQSYNYFPWRNTKEELTEYLTQITRTSVAEFFRPNLWPNTPDILTHFLQQDGRAAFVIRFMLAATLGASYGIYGPAFELCENTPTEPSGEEYLNSEKYEIKRWDLSAPQSLESLITRVNQIRRENPALQSNRNLKFHRTDNPELIAYTKSSDDGRDVILTVVNLNPDFTHSGWLDLPLKDFELDIGEKFQVHDLLTGACYVWSGPHNYIELNPAVSSAHIFRLRRFARTEKGVDFFI